MESWTGGKWVRLNPSTIPSYSPEVDGFAYDDATRQAVLFETKPASHDRDVDLGCCSWSEQHPPTSPSAVLPAYDFATNQLLLFGGSGRGADEVYADTWG